MFDLFLSFTFDCLYRYFVFRFLLKIIYESSYLLDTDATSEFLAQKNIPIVTLETYSNVISACDCLQK